MTALYISNLTLSHFRSHKRAELEFDGRPIAIWGPNGAGKTNVLEAVSLLSPGRGMRRAVADDLARRPEVLGWKIKAEMHSLHQVHEIETWSSPDNPRQLRIDDKTAPQIALGRIGRMLWLVPSMDRLWIEGADGRRRFIDRAAMSLEPTHGEAVLSYDKAMRERNRMLKDMVRDAHWYLALEGQMASAGARICANRQMVISRLATAQAVGETAFPVAHLELVHSDEYMPEDEEGLLAAFSDSRQRDLSAGRTLVGPHRSDLIATFATKGALAKDCSTGEQKALLVSLILANARALALDFGAPPIVLLDEVAAHLDATRRAALYGEIIALGAQAIMTGTGPELFEGMAGNCQSFEVIEENGVSQVNEASL